MNIGKLRLDGNLVLAPMSGVTNPPFRFLCRKHGASLVHSEMMSSEALMRDNQKTMDKGFICENERPMGIQLMGSVPGNVAASAFCLQERYRPDLIDINLGCPAQAIIKNRCGSQLLREPGLVRDIIEQLSYSLDIPVTAKIRILENFGETLKIARILEKGGADAITVHGRTQKQGYSGKSDLEFIRGIKDGLSIPVIANGDIFDENSARKVLEYTRCDGLMIGRAAIGNPFIFRRISHNLETGNVLPSRSGAERLSDFFEYMELCRNFDIVSYDDIKRSAQWFTKGLPDIKQYRVEINRTADIESIIRIMSGLKDHFLKNV